MNNKNYKVLIGYVSYNGQTIQPGVYSSLEIDVAEARNKSIVVEETSSLQGSTEVAEAPNTVKVKQPVSNYSDVDQVKEFTLEPTVTQTTVSKVEINTATSKQLVALKYVAEKTAAAVITERELAPFKSYDDLNRRVALRGKNKWEDVANIDFKEASSPIPVVLDIIKGI